MGLFQRTDPVLRTRIEAGDVAGVRAHLARVHGQTSLSWRRPGPSLLAGLRAVRHRGTRRRTCQAAFVQVSRRQDAAMLDLVAPHLATRRPVPGTWGVRTPLEVAAGDGFLAGVTRLLPVSDLSQGLVLSWAAQRGHRAVVRHLIAPGIAPGITLGHRIKAAQDAAREGHLPVLNDLLDQISTEDLSPHAFELLTAPLLKGHLACLERLLPLGVRTTDRHGDTPLMLAARHGQKACLVRLLNAPGSDPTQRNRRGQSLLMIAAQQDDVATVRTVLGLGDPWVETRRVDPEQGRTALMRAATAYGRTLEVLQALLPYSDPAQPDLQGRTAFALAWDTFALDDPLDLNEAPEDAWARLDLLALTAPPCDRPLVVRAWALGGPARMPQWAAHLEREALRATLDTSRPTGQEPGDSPATTALDLPARRRL